MILLVILLVRHVFHGGAHLCLDRVGALVGRRMAITGGAITRTGAITRGVVDLRVPEQGREELPHASEDSIGDARFLLVATIASAISSPSARSAIARAARGGSCATTTRAAAIATTTTTIARAGPIATTSLVHGW